MNHERPRSRVGHIRPSLKAGYAPPPTIAKPKAVKWASLCRHQSAAAVSLRHPRGEGVPPVPTMFPQARPEHATGSLEPRGLP